MRRSVGLPSPALAISVIALVVALGGTSYAAFTLPRNSVGSAQIKSNSVATSDIRSNAVTSTKIKNGSLLKTDFAFGQLPAGATGPAGPAGAPGPAGLTSLTRVDSAPVPQGAFGSGAEVQTATATCPAGSFVTGGGYVAGTIDDIVSFAKSGVTQYSVIAVNEFNTAGSIAAEAICASGAGVTARSVRSTATPAAITDKARSLQAELDAQRG
jgi:hypothetical protein